MNRKKWYRQGRELLHEMETLQPGQDELAAWYLGQCGFAFRYAGALTLIDPMLNDLCAPDGHSLRLYPQPFEGEELYADTVLCTHAHADHMAVPTLLGLLRRNPALRIILPAGCVREAVCQGIPRANITPIGVDGMVTAGQLTITAFSAAHPEHVEDEEDAGMCLGYRMDFGGISVVHLGDTYLTERLLSGLRSLGRIDLFLPPVNGDDLFRRMDDIIGNMNCEEAARLAADLSADMTIPTHYDLVSGNTADPLRFAAELRRLAPAAKYHIPALGECMLLRKA